MNMKIKFQKVTQFLQTDIWRIHLRDLSGSRLFWMKQLKIFLMVGKGFTEDNVQLRASALTFFSLLSVVPVVAMAFAIAKGFDLHEMFRQQLIEDFPGQKEILKYIFSFSDSLLQNTNESIIAGFGIFFLLWTVISLLNNIENSFNDIWSIKTPRTFSRKFTDNITIAVISPILFIISGSITVYITTYIETIADKVKLISYFTPFIFSLIRFSPYVIVWLLFTILYIIMPNKRINFTSALFAGIVAGTIYQIVQVIYIEFQVGVSRYNTIYGSFAALPLFLIWLQLSWLIILLGTEISWAHQNVENFVCEKDSLRMSNAFTKQVSLLVLLVLVRNFSKGEDPLRATEISETLKIPMRLVERTLHDLMEARLVSEIWTDGWREVRYQPAQDPERFTVQFILDALDHKGCGDFELQESNDLHTLNDILKTFRCMLETLPENKLLKEI